ncbi:uncharacterized protein LY89DRAFT_162613 [Mollisia scopiformis]|uniref:Uncharacterized protein n=1 Tax=Mollisia scopiformis TaxID=149040 RepID=A0A194XTE0_MOLSC|nr:uncharacterized protein LY89DRAFT_162613 [Mollisia scopiformis]KUJ22962.1 hypothetical protein LY89DRAFT_162613 [Mollisia scopiformis]
MQTRRARFSQFLVSFLPRSLGLLIKCAVTSLNLGSYIMISTFDSSQSCNECLASFLRSEAFRKEPEWDRDVKIYSSTVNEAQEL